MQTLYALDIQIFQSPSLLPTEYLSLLAHLLQV